MSYHVPLKICLPVSWTVEQELFEIHKGWIAGAFFLGLFIGGAITAILISVCLKDWQKKKRQDEEEKGLVTNEEVITAFHTDKDHTTVEDRSTPSKTSRIAAAAAFIKQKTTRKKSTKTVETKILIISDNDKKSSISTETFGIVSILMKENSGDAEAELSKQDIRDMDKLDRDQKQARDDMLLKMLKMKLRKMKNKDQLGDPYLAEFTQRIIDTRKSNQEIIEMDKKEAEEEIKKKFGKNKQQYENEIDNLQVKVDVKKHLLEKEEIENIRSELLRTSGMTEAEVEDLLEKLKQDMAELERWQGLEQARQARHLAERLEKRRQMLEFRRLQEQQSRNQALEEIQAIEEPLTKLVQDEKLLEKQKDQLIEENKKNIRNLQKQHELDAMRLQRELADKLQRRREQRLKSLEDKHVQERAVVLDQKDKSTTTVTFLTNYQNLLQKQQQEFEATQAELDHTEIQELDKLTQNFQAKKVQSFKEMTDKIVQSVTQMGGLTDYDAKQIIKIHNLRMDEFNQQKKKDRQQMNERLQEKLQQRMQKIVETEQRNALERDVILEQQSSMVQRVLNSNLELTDDAKERILREHERNMQALNNQLARSKFRQQTNLEHKLSERRARLATIRAMKDQEKQLNAKEVQKLQEQLEEEMALFEKERIAAEEALRRRLLLETEAALAQQEKDLAVIIGRLEVGQVRRQAVLQRQDKTLKELQDQLENKVSSGRLSVTTADQIIQQHYNQVEHLNNTIQRDREHQEQIINERIQAKRFKMQRELADQINNEKQEMMMARKKAGTGLASNILNAALMEKRHQKAMEDLEREMQIELGKSRDQLNETLQQNLEKELNAHKEQFLNQLAAASKLSPNEMQEIADTAAKDTGKDRQKANKYGKDLKLGVEKAKSSLGLMEEDSEGDTGKGRQKANKYGKDLKLGVEKAKSSLGMMEEDSEGESYRPRSAADVKQLNRPRSAAVPPLNTAADFNPIKDKKRNTFGPQPIRPAFTATTTGEQIHGMWDDDNDDML